MVARKALIIEDAYLHTEDAPGLDDAIVYVSENTVDITTTRGNALTLDFADLAAIQAMVDEAKKPKRMSIAVNLDTSKFDAERQRVEKVIKASLGVTFASSFVDAASGMSPQVERIAKELNQSFQSAARTLETVAWQPDWSKIPAEYKFAAVDENGIAYAYAGRPHCGSFVWHPNGMLCLRQGKVILPAGLPWTDSLCERPATDELAFLGLSWADVPDEYNYVAADKDGEVWAYDAPPRLNDDYWYCSRRNLDIKHKVPTGDWKESLRGRMATVLGIAWADVPDEYNYVAADLSGRVYGYEQRPIIVRHIAIWIGSPYTYLRDTTLPPVLSWRNTLFVRPGYTEPSS